MSATEWSMLLALGAIWGGSYFFNGVAIRELPVFTVVLSRVALAALVLLAILRLRGERIAAGRRIWLAFFGMGLLNNAIPFSLVVWGQQHVASGVASILNAATPLFTVLFAHWLTRDERITPGKLAGVLVGLAGIVVMIGVESLRGLGTDAIAQLMCLAGAASYAFAGIYGRRFRALGVTPLGTATGQVLASTLILLPLALVFDRPWTLPVPGTGVLLSLLGVAVISTALAYVLYFRILATAGATNLLLVTFLIPVSAILLGTMFLGESLLPRHLAGMALIGIGLVAIDGRMFARVAAARAQRRSSAG